MELELEVVAAALEDERQALETSTRQGLGIEGHRAVADFEAPKRDLDRAVAALPEIGEVHHHAVAHAQPDLRPIDLDGSQVEASLHERGEGGHDRERVRIEQVTFAGVTELDSGGHDRERGRKVTPTDVDPLQARIEPELFAQRLDGELPHALLAPRGLRDVHRAQHEDREDGRGSEEEAT